MLFYRSIRTLFTLALAALLCNTLAAEGQEKRLLHEEQVFVDSIERWPDVQYPPEVLYALPPDYVTLSTTKNRPSTLDKVLWAPADMTEQIEAAIEKEEEIPLPGVLIAGTYPAVKQIGPKMFSVGNAKSWKKMMIERGIRVRKVYETFWGLYPLLVSEVSIAGEPMWLAIIGLCEDEGRTLLLAMNPSTDPQQQKADYAIWQNLIKNSEYVPLSPERAIALHFEYGLHFDLPLIKE